MPIFWVPIIRQFRAKFQLDWPKRVCDSMTNRHASKLYNSRDVGTEKREN